MPSCEGHPTPKQHQSPIDGPLRTQRASNMQSVVRLIRLHTGPLRARIALADYRPGQGLPEVSWLLRKRPRRETPV